MDEDAAGSQMEAKHSKRHASKLELAKQIICKNMEQQMALLDQLNEADPTEMGNNSKKVAFSTPSGAGVKVKPTTSRAVSAKSTIRTTAAGVASKAKSTNLATRLQLLDTQSD